MKGAWVSAQLFTLEVNETSRAALSPWLQRYMTLPLVTRIIPVTWLPLCRAWTELC